MSSDRDIHELAEEIADDIREQQKEFDECSHQDITYVEEGMHWECTDCGLHFAPKSLDSGRLPEITEDGRYTRMVVKEYHPDWVRVSHVLKRLRELIYSNSGSPTVFQEAVNSLQQELEEMDRPSDLLGDDT